MTTQKASRLEANTTELNEPPIVYFEQMTQLAIGHQVSKVTFGYESSIEGVGAIPKMTIAMSTHALRMLAQHILEAFNDPANKENLVNMNAKYENMLSKHK